LIRAVGNTSRSVIQKRINCIWNKEETHQQWKEPNTVLIYKEGDKSDCSNCTAISLLPTTYTVLSNVLVSTLIPHVDEITGDHQCGFRRKRSITVKIFCICQILEKNWEYNGRVHHLYRFEKACDTVRREALYTFSLNLLYL